MKKFATLLAGILVVGAVASAAEIKLDDSTKIIIGGGVGFQATWDIQENANNLTVVKAKDNFETIEFKINKKVGNIEAGIAKKVNEANLFDKSEQYDTFLKMNFGPAFVKYSNDKPINVGSGDYTWEVEANKYPTSTDLVQGLTFGTGPVEVAGALLSVDAATTLGAKGALTLDAAPFKVVAAADMVSYSPKTGDAKTLLGADVKADGKIAGLDVTGIATFQTSSKSDTKFAVYGKATLNAPVKIWGGAVVGSKTPDGGSAKSVVVGFAGAETAMDKLTVGAKAKLRSADKSAMRVAGYVNGIPVTDPVTASFEAGVSTNGLGGDEKLESFDDVTESKTKIFASVGVRYAF